MAESTLAELLKFQMADRAPASEPAKPSQNEMIAQAILGLAPILAGAALGGAKGGAIGAEAGLTGLAKLEAGKKEAKEESEKKRAAEKERLATAVLLSKEVRGERAEERAAAQAAERLAIERERLGIERGKAGKEKQPSGPQFQAGLYARRVEQAQGVFDDLEKAGFDRSQMAIGVESALPHVLKSSLLQSQEQAEKNFVNAILRRESGAAISKSEFDSAEKQYFTRAGDSPEVIAQKKANRLQALAGLKAEAGPALEQIPLVTVEAPVSPVARAPQRFGAGDAIAAPAKPDFQSMTSEQIKAYLGIK